MAPVCRVGALPDVPQAVALWQRVFGDDEALIHRWLDDFVGPGQWYVAEQNGMVIAILSAVPCVLCGSEGVYLYALATDEGARGAGVMTALMRYAEQNEAAHGAVFSALVPDGTALFDYYRRRGYDEDVLLRHVEVSALPPGPAAALEAVECLPKALPLLREKFLGISALSFDARRMLPVAEDIQASGAVPACCAEGYLVWQQGERKLWVAELGAASDAAAYAMLRAVAARLGGMPLHITLPAGSKLFAGQGKAVPYALIKPLVRGHSFANVYMRFVMDA